MQGADKEMRQKSIFKFKSDSLPALGTDMCLHDVCTLLAGCIRKYHQIGQSFRRYSGCKESKLSCSYPHSSHIFTQTAVEVAMKLPWGANFYTQMPPTAGDGNKRGQCIPPNTGRPWEQRGEQTGCCVLIEQDVHFNSLYVAVYISIRFKQNSYIKDGDRPAEPNDSEGTCEAIVWWEKG